jgi:hypothetical protein
VIGTFQCLVGVTVLALGLAGLASRAEADDEHCPPDSVAVGPACIDKYEASVWETTNAALIKKIQRGRVTPGDLTAAGAIQRGVASDDYGAGCPDTGNGCTHVYAVSIPGVTPSAFLTWFQATAAARNSGKRLPSYAEWQAAALGTPDGAPCIIDAGGPGLTGTAGCVSDVGAFDMVGNVWEWVAQWVEGSPPVDVHGEQIRGRISSNTGAGLFAVLGPGPFNNLNGIAFLGFRAAR